MAVRTTNNSGTFELVPPGMHLARCFRVIDCGTHTDKKFGKKKRQGYLFWELPNLHRADSDSPMTIAKRYTLSHNAKANLRLDLESWYGQQFDERRLDEAGGFDLEKLIGRPALLNIVHSEDGKFANVASVNPLPNGMVCPPPLLKTMVFSLNPYDPAKFEELSDGMKDYVSQSDEWQAMNGRHRPAGGTVTGDGIIPDRSPPLSSSPPGHPSIDDVPFGDPLPTSRRVTPPPTGGRFDDMDDDIPF